METSSGSATGGGTAIGNWSDFGTPAAREQSTTQEHGGSNSCKFTVNAQYEGIESDPFTVLLGTTYIVDCWVYPDDTTTVDIRMIQGGGSTTLTQNFTGLTEKAWNNIITTFECIQAGTGAHIVFSSPTGQTSGNWFIDDVTFKEQGTASGWTEADQQLDIPQTALQSYNQLAWFGDTDTATATQYVTLKTDITTFRGETLSFWFITDTDDEQVLVSGLLNCGAYGNPTINDGGNIGKITVANAGAADSEVMTATTWNDGQWHHCVVVVEGDGTNTDVLDDTTKANAMFSIYVDGEEQTLETDGGYRGTTDALIGCRKLGGVYKYSSDGSITEVSAWSNEFTAAEVNELYNDGKALNAEDHSQYTNCIGYWRNNGLAPWINIKAPGTNNGVITGLTETLLLPAGVDASRDNQGFLMNRQKDTNSLNLPSSEDDAPTIAVGEYVDVGAIINDDVFSICCWFKSAYGVGPSGENQHIICNRDSADEGWLLKIDSAGDISFDIGDGTDEVECDSNSNAVVDTWVHIAYTYAGSAGAIKSYINGVAGGTATATDVGNMSSISSKMRIGARSFTSAMNAVNGQVDDVLYYDDVLEADEVLRIYNAGKRSHR